MKIIYAAGNIDGSNLRLSHFLRHTSHDVMIAAFYQEHEYLPVIHWTLDAIAGSDAKKIYKSFGKKIKANYDLFVNLLDDVSRFNPDVIISDYEFYLNNIANLLSIPVISCTPLYAQVCLRNIVDLSEFKNSRKLIYSPFGDVVGDIDDYEWVKPYPESVIYRPRNTNNMQSFLSKEGMEFSTGNSQNLEFQIGKRICISEDPNSIECFINARLSEKLNIATSIGMCENTKNSFNKLESVKSFNPNFQIKYNRKYLHEII